MTVTIHTPPSTSPIPLTNHTLSYGENGSLYSNSLPVVEPVMSLIFNADGGGWVGDLGDDREAADTALYDSDSEAGSEAGSDVRSDAGSDVRSDAAVFADVEMEQHPRKSRSGGDRGLASRLLRIRRLNNEFKDSKWQNIAALQLVDNWTKTHHGVAIGKMGAGKTRLLFMAIMERIRRLERGASVIVNANTNIVRKQWGVEARRAGFKGTCLHFTGQKNTPADSHSLSCDCSACELARALLSDEPILLIATGATLTRRDKTVLLKQKEVLQSYCLNPTTRGLLAQFQKSAGYPSRDHFFQWFQTMADDTAIHKWMLGWRDGYPADWLTAADVASPCG